MRPFHHEAKKSQELAGAECMNLYSKLPSKQWTLTMWFLMKLYLHDSKWKWSNPSHNPQTNLLTICHHPFKYSSGLGQLLVPKSHSNVQIRAPTGLHWALVIKNYSTKSISQNSQPYKIRLNFHAFPSHK